MYVELHCHSGYSFLDGASTPNELAAVAAEQGYEALAITDHEGVWGAMEFAHACKGAGIRPLVGAELTVTPEPSLPRLLSRVQGAAPWPKAVATPVDARHPRMGGTDTPALDSGYEPQAGVHVTLLVESREGWRNLCRLVTEAHAGTRPNPARDPLPPSLPLASLERHSEGLVCLSGCPHRGAVAGLWERGRSRAAEDLARRLLAIFGSGRFRVELQRPLWRHDRTRNRWLQALAERLGVPAVATGNVHAHGRERARLQDALVAVRLGSTLEEAESERQGNRESILLPPAMIAERFRDHEDAVAESGRLAERLEFDLTRDLGYSYPGAEDAGADLQLGEICRARLGERYAGKPEMAEAKRRLEEELELIRSLRLSGFFLLHHDLLELAREVALEVRGPASARSLLPPGRGRGSSVSSIVCYLTGLSHVDPVKNKLFLGRFLNEDLREPPDIDLDFPRDIREKLIPRVHERYGPERSALVAAFATYRARGAVRDLGKALGLPAGEIERLAKATDMHGSERRMEEEIAATLGKQRAGEPRWRALAELVWAVAGLPRHVSQHPGGMVISTTPLIELCPVQPAAMEGRQLVQWDKDSCADAGFLKIDLLGLGMLSAVERCVEEIARVRHERIDLSRIPLDDEEVFGDIRKAETTGVFQIESRAQMQMLPRTLPRNLDDLTVQVALVRPGPIQGGAVHPYIERRKRLREDPEYRVPYEHPSLEQVLRDTLGAIVFQDQVLEVAIALAGFTPGEAEGLRRAMSRKRSEEAIRGYRRRFIEGAERRGVRTDMAERVFGQIQGFSGFGFPKAHATAFGLLAYQSTWLRVHYGAEFLCSLLNEQPMGFYPPDALIHEAQRRGIEVLPADVNRSEVDCSVEWAGATCNPPRSSQPRPHGPPRASQASQPAVRIGLGYINGAVEEEMKGLVAEREHGGPFRDLADVAARSGAGRATLERLAWAGACDELAGGDRDVARRIALWRVGGASRAVGTPAGTQLALPLDSPSPPSLPALVPWERVVADYRSTGVVLDGHPMGLFREELGDGVVSSRDLPRIEHGRRIELAGMVVARQRPATARGVVFMLLEDEWGTINLIVPPPVFERHRLAARTAGFVRVEGRLEHREGTINLVVDSLEALQRPDLPPAEVRHIEPPPERETGRGAIAAELTAALPAAHSFGRRGR